MTDKMTPGQLRDLAYIANSKNLPGLAAKLRDAAARRVPDARHSGVNYLVHDDGFNACRDMVLNGRKG